MRLIWILVVGLGVVVLMLVGLIGVLELKEMLGFDISLFLVVECFFIELLIVDLVGKGWMVGMYGGLLDMLVGCVKDVCLINVWGYVCLVGYN